MKSVIRFLVLTIVLGMVLSGCGTTMVELGGGGKSTASITGTIFYRERMPLPPKAVVSIALEDVSRMDAPVTVLKKMTFSSEGKQVPFPFELVYDPSKINPKHQYALRARIEIADELRFINDSRIAVITDQQKTHNVDIQLKAVGKH